MARLTQRLSRLEGGSVAAYPIVVREMPGDGYDVIEGRIAEAKRARGLDPKADAEVLIIQRRII